MDEGIAPETGVGQLRRTRQIFALVRSRSVLLLLGGNIRAKRREHPDEVPTERTLVQDLLGRTRPEELVP